MRYAILLDGGFVYKKLGARLRHVPSSGELHEFVLRIQAHDDLHDLHLLRSYYYDSPPAEGILFHPIDGSRLDLSATPVCATRRRFHEEVQLLPDFALRLGETRAASWRLKRTVFQDVVRQDRPARVEDLEPNLQQKGVDLRIGLDIARLSLRRLVDLIVVVTGDSDLIPAFRFARREGIRVFLVNMGHGVYPQLKYHADRVLDV